MNSKHFSVVIMVIAMALLGAVSASAQIGALRGSVKMIGSDGKPSPVAGATVDVYRTDIAGDYHTKTDKKGEWVFAGLPYLGTYIVAVSAPGAQPTAQGGVLAGREVPVDVQLSPGNGKRLTLEEAKAAAGGSSSGAGGSGADNAKREEMNKQTEEVKKANEKTGNINQILGDSFKAGNAALTAKNYDEAIKQYDIGLAADAEQPAILTNKAAAMKSRGVDRYNAAIQLKDEAARNAGLESAKADFHGAFDAANKATEILNKEPAATDSAGQQRHNSNRYSALSVRAEAARLFVAKADPTQADAGIAAFQEYMAAETDPAKKLRAQFDLAHMLMDAGAADKAFVEFQKILAEKPDDPDANLGAGLALYGTGDKTKYQEAANYLQHFVDNAPDTNKDKADIKAVLAELKNTENVVPEKTPPRRRRP